MCSHICDRVSSFPGKDYKGEQQARLAKLDKATKAAWPNRQAKCFASSSANYAPPESIGLICVCDTSKMHSKP